MRFLYVLARDLGRTVGELMATMSAEELTYWRALYNLEAKERSGASRDRKAAQLAQAAKRSRRGK